MIDSKTTIMRGLDHDGRWQLGSFLWTGSSYYIVTIVGNEKDSHSGLIVGPSFMHGSETKAVEVDSTTLGRIVGMADTRGRMAFEGDIIVPDNVDSAARGHIRFGQNRKDRRVPASEIGFWVEWEDPDFWRNDIGYWLRNAHIVGNEAGVPMPSAMYEDLAKETWLAKD